MKMPATKSGQAKEKSNRCHFGHRGKRFMIVETRHLTIPFGNKASFQPFDRSINLVFNLVDPFITDGLLATGKGGQCPSIVGLESSEFSVHSRDPRWIEASLGERLRLLHGRNIMKESTILRVKASRAKYLG